MEVVEADRADAEALARIFIAARRAAMPWLPELRDAAGVPRYFADAVIAEGEVLVVRRAGVPAAFLALRGDMIEHLYVRPTRNATGSERRWSRPPRTAGPPVFGCGSSSATTARAFYARRGFTEVELTDGAGNDEREPDVLLAWTGSTRS